MARVRVKIVGLDKFAKKQTLAIRKVSELQLGKIAKDTENIIKQNIRESIRRPGSTGNLENSFFAEKINDRSWGIGNIPLLNKQAPYWRWINFGIAGTGRTTPPGTNENSKIRGAFTPGQTAPDSSKYQGGRFVKGGFPMNPTKPIQAHNFIQRTLFLIPSIVSRILKGKI